MPQLPNLSYRITFDILIHLLRLFAFVILFPPNFIYLIPNHKTYKQHIFALHKHYIDDILFFLKSKILRFGKFMFD